MPEDVERTFVTKLRGMTNSQQSVQTTSLWVQFYQNKAKLLVTAWKTEIIKSSSKKKLTYMYLANDIIQTSRKKTMDFVKEFAIVLPQVIPEVWRTASEKDQERIKRILDIWEQRRVYSSSFIGNLRSCSKETKKPKVENPLIKALENADKVKEENKAQEFMTKQKLVDGEAAAVLNEINRQESNLSSLPLEQLQTLQNSFSNFLSDITKVRNGLERELEKQGEVIRIMENELPRLQESVNTLKPVVSQYSEQLKKVQLFLSKLQVHVSVKSLVSGNGSSSMTTSESQPVGGGNYDPPQSLGSSSTDYEPRLRSPPHKQDGIFDDEAPPRKKQRKDNSPFETPSTPSQLLMQNPPPPAPDFNTLFSELSTPNTLVSENNTESNNSHLESGLDSGMLHMDTTSSLSNVGMNINTPPFYEDN